MEVWPLKGRLPGLSLYFLTGLEPVGLEPVLDLGICFELYKIKIRCETLTNMQHALQFVEIH